MNVKSVSAGTRASPPPQVPKMAVICGITPDAIACFSINLTKCVQCICSLLKSQTCAVDQSDHRSAHLHCHVVQICNLLCVHLTDGAAQYGSILTVNIYQVSINHTVSGDYAVCRCLLSAAC